MEDNSCWLLSANNTDPGTNSATGTRTSIRPNIQLAISYGNCTTPTGLVSTYPACEDTEVVLGWTENGEATAWQICLNGDETNLIEASTNPFTLTGLTPEMNYTAKVRASAATRKAAGATLWAFSLPPNP